MSRNGDSNVETGVLPAQAGGGEERASRWQRIRELAESLAHEFTAPVGVLDPVQRTWQIILGAKQEDFPRLGNPLFEVAASSGLRLGQVAIWRPRDDPGRVWLLLPLPWADVADAVAFAGFQDVRLVEANQAAAGNVRSAQPSQPPRWGPPCPNQALSGLGAEDHQRNAECSRNPGFSLSPRILPATRRASGWSLAG